MTSHMWMLAFCFSLASVLQAGESVSTAETRKYTCRTFGSGVVQPFNSSAYHVRSNCPFTLTRFTHNRVECDITTRRADSGLLSKVEITVNKIRTVVQSGSILVEKKSVSLPYDHTYQHIFQYGTYIKLRSSLLPLSVTWHNVPGGIDTLGVELEQELSTDMTGLCGKHNVPGNKQQLIAESVLTEDTCQTRDPVSAVNPLCRLFFSYTLDCLQARIHHYIQLCEENIYSHESSEYVGCAFFNEVVQQCGNSSYIWNIWRDVTRCAPPTCTGDLVYVEHGAAFVPTCSNPIPRQCGQDFTSSCVCPKGTVLDDAADGFRCVNVSDCPCVFADGSYSAGDTRSTKCQSCACDGGKWRCSENYCPARCLVEGQFVTTFDGKHYVVPGKCTYVVSQGLNWIITVQFAEKDVSLKTVVLQLFRDMYTFSFNSVKVGEEEITELHQSDHALVFWQSSMYVQVQTSFGMKIQVQMSPEVQLYITPPRNHTGIISGLCGNSNNDTTDDFTTGSGIIENSPQTFALSWSVGTCAVNIPTICSSTDSEIFADEKCSVLNNPTGIFAKCHGHIPTDQFHTACIQRTCNCGSNLQHCLCVALGSYANACAVLGVAVGDWREATNCTLKCQRNQEFSDDVRACNRTCRSLSGPDPRCWVDDAPVEGCGCPEGTHLNQGHVCTPKADCVCHHYGGTTPPGPVVIDGRQCLCENGELHCSKDCGCRNGKVCVHCSEYLVNTTRKTCDSLSKPLAASVTCVSGCHCPHDQYEDHRGNCVSLDSCTCVYSGKMFSAGQRVKTNCKTCICDQGQWHCEDQPCPGMCQVYGNGHYQTFDSKWYRFNGHCQYTLVEDYCGNKNGSFSVRVESVPCCDEALTCSRSIVLDLQGTVTLTLSDMTVTRRLQNGWTLQEDSLYTTHTVGLYIIITVPSRGITLIWDKHTRVTIELHPNWRNRVCGLCGNFDSSEMNDLQMSGSAAVSSPLAFGNSWKAASPPCSDVTTEIFPCERNSYCSAWAQRRCMIITSDAFKDCHLKVDQEPYYHACVQESCSCEFEGKFLGFCTAVAAYAEACSDQDVCVKWRTPDLCPVYCDYYNDQGQCTWHYEACGEMLTCRKGHFFSHKLEGCYPRCPKDAPYYDENTQECTTLRNCSCNFNDTIIQPGAVVKIQSNNCPCENGTINCRKEVWTTTPSTTSTPTTTSPTTTTETWTTPTITSTPTTTTARTTTEAWTTLSSTTPTPLTTITNVSTTTEVWTTPSTTSTPTTTTPTTTTETWTTTPSTTSTSGAAATTTTNTVTEETTVVCKPCRDLKRKKTWACGEMWIEDCFHMTCTNGKIELTPVDCPEPIVPVCPRDQVTKVSDGCCETWKCDCRCELYGDPHYISFEGVPFDFLDQCTYILVEEQSPQHNLSIAVDNFYCVQGLHGSCAKGIILIYQDNIATLGIVPNVMAVQATLNNVTIQPPYEEHGLRFETTGYMVSIYLPEVRSYVSLSPSYTLVINLAMEHFLNNTQGQCGVCGGGSCIRRGGQIEDDSCCDKTAYDWVLADPLKSSCVSPPRDVPCHPGPTPAPTNTPISTTTCPVSPLCGLLDDPVFSICKEYVNLHLKKKNCEFDSCGNSGGPCSSLEQAAEECKNAGICIEWRKLTNGICDVQCAKGLVYSECHDKLDDFCYGGVRHSGASLEKNSTGCFCPRDQFRAGNHSTDCVSDCPYCKGPLGEPRLPGEVWQSACHLCTCNNQTRTEECFRKPKSAPLCGSNAVLVNTSCCGDQICVEKTCSYDEKTYKVGDTWKNSTHPCVLFSCSIEGIETETKVCPRENCSEGDGVWDDEHCCFTCNQSCAPEVSSFNITVDNCTTVIEMPVCQGQCVSQPRVVIRGDLQVEHESRCCQERSSERRSVTLQCSDLTTRQYAYRHITRCEFQACNILR
ncbi:putative mucin-19-like isoform 3 [Scophthalmus maximus]|uniref:Putative mucin-19-like isoform 3 n=1 Tax=Scophthalmus maximus TaxID=52904 RepID=A0A2U9B1U9_SCOMX|nr:putative mucin-19-like isoform 3 [Scophthalmus maximus]